MVSFSFGITLPEIYESPVVYALSFNPGVGVWLSSAFGSHMPKRLDRQGLAWHTSNAKSFLRQRPAL